MDETRFSKAQFSIRTIIDYTDSHGDTGRYCLTAVNFEEGLLCLQGIPDSESGMGDWPEPFWARHENCEIVKAKEELKLLK